MKIGNGPAAVIGDDGRTMSLSGVNGWEDAADRMIRESEDLPGHNKGAEPRGEVAAGDFAEKRAFPGSRWFSVRVFFRAMRGMDWIFGRRAFAMGPGDRNHHREKETIMYLYWRVQQDLDTLGETLHFNDPSLVRSLRSWVRKNGIGLYFADQMAMAGPKGPFYHWAPPWFGVN